MNLMDKYNELRTTSEYPPDYAERWALLAAMFLADGRPLLSKTCRRKAAYYSDPTVLCGSEGVKWTVVGSHYYSKRDIKLIEVTE